ncbi:MAG: hypothetical protein R3C68_06315 [Myxococcota bacterium]
MPIRPTEPAWKEELDAVRISVHHGRSLSSIVIAVIVIVIAR